MQPLLQAQTITKRFPGVLALDQVSFDIRPGEVHALCGENGAGKSTLIKILAGIHIAGSYEGELRVEGSTMRFANISDAEAAGIAVIHQELALIDDLTVAENIALGRETSRLGVIDDLQQIADARALLQRFGLAIDPSAQLGSLGTGQQQLVEIVRALAKNSRILVLDEPTAALTGVETEVLLGILRDLRQDGVGIVYISHKLDEVFAIADRITVLRDGRSISTHVAQDIDEAVLIRDMVGRSIDDVFPKTDHPHGDVLLELEALCVDDDNGDPKLHDLSFQVRAGEVLGIGGLMGAGRSETLLHMMGAWGRRRSGQIRYRGQAWQPRSPRQAILNGMVLVGEDRKGSGLVLDHSINANLSLASLRSIGTIITDMHAETQRNSAMVKRLRIKIASLLEPVLGLSGGNQQKVVIGKALLTEPTIILLDEPTRGIDIGAKQEVYALLQELCAAGLAVVMVSSEMPELLGLSDRIVMLSEGRVGGTFAAAEADQERLFAAAIAGHKDAVVESPTAQESA